VRLPLGLRPDPPLVPGPDEARDELRRELVRPEYQQDFLSRALDRIQRLFQEAAGAAADAGVASYAAALVVFLLLGLCMLWLVSRARASAAVAADHGPVLTPEQVTAAQLRRRAEEALSEGRLEDAVVDGVRALTVRQVERGRLELLPGATAREVTLRLAADFEDHRPRLARLALLFDSVRYGRRRATTGDAESVLALDDDLAGAR
jgi:hypothetical protein